MILRTIAQTIEKNDINVPKGNLTDASFSAILQLVFGLLGAIALLVIVIAGLRYVISQGDPQAVAKAKNTIIYALVGLVIAVAAFSIVSFVIRNTQ